MSERISAPDFASHTLAVWSWLAVTIREPSGLKDAELTQPSCPLSVRISSPVVASQILAVSSWLAVRMRDPSGLNDADET